MKRSEFEKDLISLINNIPSTWEGLKPFFDENVKEVSDKHFPKNINAHDNLEDVMKLIFRLKNRLD